MPAAPVANPSKSTTSTASSSRPTPANTQTPMSVNTQTPTPATVDVNDPSSWVIGFTSVGPVALGDDMDAATQSMSAFATNSYFAICPTIASFEKTGFPDFIMTSEEDGTVRQIVLQGGSDPLGVASSSPQTSEGIGIGSTAEGLEAAYPTLSDLNDYSEPHYAETDGNGTWIHFGLSDGIVHVIVVHAYPNMPNELCG